MLKELRIKNFALIDELNIEFDEGLNVLTGETGAGKSIIVDAIELICGARNKGDEVRSKENKAIIEAAFLMVQKNGLSELLAEFDIETEEDEILIKRSIDSSGKSRCYVNGSMVNLSTLKKLGVQFLDIHGQHEHQSLLNSSTHVEILDACCELSHLRVEFLEKYNQYMSHLNELSGLKEKDKLKSEQVHFLSMLVSDIEKADIKENEEEILIEEHKVLANAVNLIQGAQEAYDELYLSENSILSRMKKIQNQMQNLGEIDTSFENYEKSMNSSFLELEELALELRSYSTKTQSNSERLLDVENRLLLFSELKRKYKAQTTQELLVRKAEAKKELEQLDTHKEQIQRLKEAISFEKELLDRLAIDLAERRKKEALNLEKKVESELKDLNIEDGRFIVDFDYSETGLQSDGSLDKALEYMGQTVKIYPYGIGKTEFLISLNPGMPKARLSKIASGGEISRIMLVLKKVLAQNDKIPTMIFDEIDSGTGGKTAEMIGEKLKTTSKTHQIILITHLPQIAGKANCHFKIQKISEDDFTRTIVAKLKEKERIEELARMAGGKNITKTTLKHAKEMMCSL